MKCKMIYDGGIPVFSPSYDEFADFQKFMDYVNPYGMICGLCKILPPKEWIDSLPPYAKIMQNEVLKMSKDGKYQEKALASPSLDIDFKCSESSILDKESTIASVDHSRPNPVTFNSALLLNNVDTTACSLTVDATIVESSYSSNKNRHVDSVILPSVNPLEDINGLENAPRKRIKPSRKSINDNTIDKKSIPSHCLYKHGVAKLANVVMEKPIGQRFEQHYNGIIQYNCSYPQKYYVIDFFEHACDVFKAAINNINQNIGSEEESNSIVDSNGKLLYCELEKLYWKTIANATPIYGADFEGSLFPSDFDVWNIARLPNLLDYLSNCIPGVNSPYLYFGMWQATFAWHLEDVDLYSINYIHYGEPKQWYCIPQKYKKKFEKLAMSIFKLGASQCDQFLRHKAYLISPDVLKKNGIQVNKIIHRANEIMITFPLGYHSGFNYGFNFAESTNFALHQWLEIGKLAKSCKCRDNAVSMDVSVLESLIPPVISKKARAKFAVSAKCVICSNIFDVATAGRFTQFDLDGKSAHEQCILFACTVNQVDIPEPSELREDTLDMPIDYSNNPDTFKVANRSQDNVDCSLSNVSDKADVLKSDSPITLLDYYTPKTDAASNSQGSTRTDPHEKSCCVCRAFDTPLFACSNKACLKALHLKCTQSIFLDAGFADLHGFKIFCNEECRFSTAK